MSAFFRLIAAGPLFFVSDWLLMLFAGIVAADVGIAACIAGTMPGPAGRLGTGAGAADQARAA